MYQGDSKRLHFTITDGSGAPLDISDAAVTWQASKGSTSRFSLTPVLTKAIGAGLTITDELNGALVVELLPADTENLRGSFYYELEIQDASGDVATAATGQFTVKPSLVK